MGKKPIVSVTYENERISWAVYIEILSFSYVTETIGFLPIQILIFRMFNTQRCRFLADAHIWSLGYLCLTNYAYFLAYRCCKENTSSWIATVNFTSGVRVYFFMFNRDKSSFANLVPRYFSLVNLNMRKGPLHVYIEMEQAINNTTFLLSYFFH